MALEYRDNRTGVTRTMLEPSEVKAREEDPYHGDWLAMHQRRTIQKMDESRRWERVTKSPASSPPASPPAPPPTPSESTSVPTPEVTVSEGLDRPAVNDSKDAWIEWAVHRHGYDRGEANGLTKDQLRELD